VPKRRVALKLVYARILERVRTIERKFSGTNVPFSVWKDRSSQGSESAEEQKVPLPHAVRRMLD